MDKGESAKLRELEARRESLGIEFMTASTPEEVEYIKSEMSKVDYEIEELRNSSPTKAL